MRREELHTIMARQSDRGATDFSSTHILDHVQKP